MDIRPQPTATASGVSPTPITKLYIDNFKTMFIPVEIKEGKLIIGKVAAEETKDAPTNFLEILSFINSKLELVRADGSRVPIPMETELKVGEVFQLNFDNAKIIGKIHATPEDFKIEQSKWDPLVSTEIRMSLNGALTEQKMKPPEDIRTPTTDLHTHFAGIMTADMLMAALNLKKERGQPVNYPVKVIKEMKITIKPEYLVSDGKGNNFVDVTKFTSDDLIKLREKLHIPRDKTIIFNEMEKYYEYRDPLIKDVTLLEFYLEQIALEYKKQGLTYAEISLSKVADPEWLKIINRVVPRLEEQGVKIRFLGTLARTVSEAKKTTQVDIYEKFTTQFSPYVLGIDLLAAEKDSTYDNLQYLERLSQWAMTNFRPMVIRVHAGESSYHPENIEGVVSLAENFPDLFYRVGHGVYGASQETTERMKKLRNILPEINMASNQALNSLGDIGKHTVTIYHKNGIPVVFGSDGGGLYQFEAKDSFTLLSHSKYLTPQTFLELVDKLKKTEQDYIEFADRVTAKREKEFKKNMIHMLKHLESKSGIPGKTAFDDYEALFAMEKEVKPEDREDYIFKKLLASPHYDDVWNQINKQYKQRKLELEVAEKEADKIEQKIAGENKANLLNFYGERGVVICRDFAGERPVSVLEMERDPREVKYAVSERLPEDIRGKTPIMLTGMIFEGEDKITNLKELYAFIKTLLATLDPEKVYFATTGKEIGIQKIVHELIRQHNEEHKADKKKQFAMVGYAPSNTPTDEMSPHLTHIVLVEDVSSPYSLYEYIAKILKEDNLKLITVGGGMWNKDVIQIADSVIRDPLAPPPVTKPEEQLFLMYHVKGESRDKAKELPGRYRYVNYPQVIQGLRSLTKEGITPTHVGDLFHKHKAGVPEGVAKLQGRVQSSTPSQIANKIIIGFLGLPQMKSLALSSLRAKIDDKEQMLLFIKRCENQENIQDTFLYGIMMKHKFMAYKFKELALHFKIPIPGEILKLISEEKGEKIVSPSSPGSPGLFQDGSPSPSTPSSNDPTGSSPKHE